MKYKQNLRIDGNRVFSYNTHVATLDSANRKLIVHGYWSVTTSKHVNHVADTYGLTVVKQDKSAQAEPDQDSGLLKSVAMVAKLGALFASTPKEENDWKLRMMRAGLETRGLSVPDDWNTLPEEVKTQRLNAALGVIS